jgi:mono/diheme cytochrome c family protein
MLAQSAIGTIRGELMRRLIRFISIALAVLFGLLAVAAAVIYGVSEARLRSIHQVDVVPPAIPSDPASVERGRHLVTAVTMCAACHSSSLERPDLAGNIFLDVPPALLTAPNLSGGAGGVGARYTDADWARAIRHGIRPDGTPLLFMPTANFYHLSDADLGAIIAYIRSLPPIDNQPPASQIYPLGRALLAAGQIQLPADVIDHDAPRVEAPPPGRTVEYGRYLTAISVCRDCHGGNLSGGPIEEPGAPPAPNLTPGGALPGWSEADFIHTLRTGVRPDGSSLRAPMPWQAAALMTDDELGAIYRYLRSLPALPFNTPVNR